MILHNENPFVIQNPIRYELQDLRRRRKAVLDGYTSVYTNRLESISGKDIHYWYGTKESFVAKPQVKHLKALYKDLKVEVFDKMNHGQLLVDHPDKVAERLIRIQYE